MVKVSVIIPARNEENLIHAAIARLRQSPDLFPVEIIVVDGGSADRTVELAMKGADQVILSKRACRSFQMHLGAQSAQGEILVFLHADSRLPFNWQDRLMNAFYRRPDPPVALAFRIRFDSQKPFFRALARLANLRTKITGVPYGDQGLIVARQAYFASGGYPDVPLMEEYLFIPSLRRLGKILVDRSETITSARKYATRGPVRNALRNLALVLLFYLGVSPEQLSKLYWRNSNCTERSAA